MEATGNEVFLIAPEHGTNSIQEVFLSRFILAVEVHE
jgi:hypothetical protein